MQNVNIRTAQNVSIGYELAGLGSRMWAFVIDSVIQGVYIIVALWLLGQANINSLWVFFGFYLPVFFYHLISEIVLNGQSIGKKQFNIKVVKLDGSPPTLGGYILRWILRPVDIGIFSGAVAVISIAMSNRGQRVGDMAAGTTVVKVSQPAQVSSHQLIKNLESDYKIIFPEVSRLSDHEINIIKEALLVNKKTANIKPVLAVTEKIKSHLNINSDLPPVKFLYTVIKDYKFLTSQV